MKNVAVIVGLIFTSTSVLSQFNAGKLYGEAHTSAKVNGIGSSFSQAGGTFQTTAGFSSNNLADNLNIKGYSTGSIEAYAFNISSGGGATGYSKVFGETYSAAKQYSDYYAPGQKVWVSGSSDSGYFDSSKGTRLNIETAGVNTGIQGLAKTSGNFTVAGKLPGTTTSSDGSIVATSLSDSVSYTSSITVNDNYLIVGTGATSALSSVIVEGEFEDPKYTQR